ncbi:MAG: response regulator, partial [Lachnospiraceae bacterium]|nr:response regulator [Lachnospiraceae bacterium]
MVHGERTSDKEKILIIDDVEENRLILEEIIKSMGCNPVLADSGETALDMIKESLPQLILTDISMPGIDGYELCKRLKNNDRTRGIPIVFISAFDNPEDILEGFRLGGEDYITKPFISEVVQARVGVHLRLYEAKRELMETNRLLQASVNEQLKQMEMEKKNILYAMANVASQNASYEKEHMQRLGRNCKILAQGMQLSPTFENKISDTYIDTIELAAPLCDIGNIGIPVEILRKENLTEEETAIICNHAEIGAKLLSDLYVGNDYNDFVSMSIDIARHHHENWDGSGYPGIHKGEDIPLAAQIVSVVDRYCSLTEKKNCTKEEALEIMAEESGVRFNPDIYKICCK